MSKAHSIELLSDEAFGWYFSGLTDGEGCFSLRVDRPRWRGSRCPRWRADFVLRLRADETAHVAAIARRMGCGSLYGFTPKPSARNKSPEVIWQVGKATDLAETLVPHFDHFPLQLKKARDFIIWRPCVLLLREVAGRPSWGRAGAQGRTKLADGEAEFLADSLARLKAIRQYDAEVPGSLLPGSRHDRELPLFPR